MLQGPALDEGEFDVGQDTLKRDVHQTSNSSVRAMCTLHAPTEEHSRAEHARCRNCEVLQVSNGGSEGCRWPGSTSANRMLARRCHTIWRGRCNRLGSRLGGGRSQGARVDVLLQLGQLLGRQQRLFPRCIPLLAGIAEAIHEVVLGRLCLALQPHDNLKDGRLMEDPVIAQQGPGSLSSSPWLVWPALCACLSLLQPCGGLAVVSFHKCCRSRVRHWSLVLQVIHNLAVSFMCCPLVWMLCL